MPSPMPKDDFWRIIDRVGHAGDDPDQRLSALKTALETHSLDEITSFEMTFRRLLNEAYSWDLWGAAYVIHGGCSDDSFEYFRRWLVSRGRETYEAAISHPDSLANLSVPPTGLDGVWEFEDFYYVAGDVFQEKGGVGDVRDHSETEAGLGRPLPSGNEFSEDDEHLKARYPKLWLRFGSTPLC